MDSGILEQLAEKKWYSPFPQFQTTQRPGPGSTCGAGGKDRIVMRQLSGRSHSADRPEFFSEDE